MSNVALFNPSQVPSFARKGELSDIAKALAGGGAGQSGERISIKGGVFRKYAGGKEIGAIEDRHMNVIIVKMAHKASRMFYDKGYKEGEKVSPACWSSDSDKPDEGVKTPVASSCTTCPNSAKGFRRERFRNQVQAVMAHRSRVTTRPSR